jgi:tetratricopeptide (TPR) repeat protein
MRIINTLPKNEQSANSNPLSQKEKQAPVEQVANITDSGNIRKNVWKGAITAWRHHPIFGTGVETFAFAYYKYKPPEQNLVTEWDYLYNKAHNEYLNYAATTGTFGIVTYLFFIGYFLILSSKWLLKKGLHHLTNLGLQETEYTATQDVVLIIGIVCGFITILVSNFFGFSVVITNLYLFLIPIFVFLLMQRSNIPAISSKQKIVEQSRQTYLSKPSSYGWAGICIIWIICIFILLQLYQFWIADKKYALGYNLNRINRFQEAYILLSEAVNKRGSEPVFQDELAYSSAMLAREFAKQNDTVNASKYAKEALAKSDSLFTSYPNNVVFLKNRVRTLYALGEIDPQFIGMALQTILKAYEMAPNDAKIGYNAGLLLGQAGQVQQGIDILERIKRIKPDFRDVYFALGIFYRDLATAGEGKTVKDPILQKKAEDNMRYILQNLNPNDKQVLDYLSSWGVR